MRGRGREGNGGSGLLLDRSSLAATAGAAGLQEEVPAAREEATRAAAGGECGGVPARAAGGSVGPGLKRRRAVSVAREA